MPGTTNANHTKLNLSTASAIIGSAQPTLGNIHSNVSDKPQQLDNKVTCVEEFCPDGGTIDKGFLDDFSPTSGHTSAALAKQVDTMYDSDSDNNDGDNPLVAKFQEDDPSIDIPIRSNSLLAQQQQEQQQPNAVPRINPLAKNKNKNLNSSLLSNAQKSFPPKRRTSLSSEDIEMPAVMKSYDNQSSASNDDFDSWLSDTNDTKIRRSPEGGEDDASLPSIDTTLAARPNTIPSTAVSATDGDEKKKLKTKKKKKDKKEKTDKTKKRSSRSNQLENFLSEDVNKLTLNDRTTADDNSAYEAF